MADKLFRRRRRRPATGISTLRISVVFLLLASFSSALILSLGLVSCGTKEQGQQRGSAGRAVTLVVMYFQNTSGDASLDWMDAGIAELLTINLSLSPDLKLIRPSRLATALRIISKEELTSLDAATAVEVARGVGAERALVGSFDKDDDVLSIEAQLIDVSSNAPVGKARAEGQGLESLFASVNELTAAVEKKLAAASAGKPDICAWTTTSAQAYEAFAKGSLAFRRFNSAAGMVHMSRAVDIDSTFSLACAAMAIFAYGSGDTPRAQSFVGHASIFPDRLPEPEKTMITAIAAHLSGQYEQSFHYYEQLKDLGVVDPGVHLGLAQLYFSLKDYKSAEQLYNNILRQDPQHHIARIKLGLTHLEMDMKDLAAAEIEKALREQPDDPYALLAMSRVYAYQGRLEDSLLQLKKASQLNSEDPWIHNLLGYLYLNHRSPQLAVEEFKRYVALAPDDPNAHDSMAEGYLRIGKRDLAEEEYLQALRLKPDFANPHYMLGIIYSGKGEKERAIERFKEYLRISPSGPLSEQAQENLEKLGYF